MLALNDLARSLNGELLLAGLTIEIPPGRPAAFAGLSQSERDGFARLLTGVDKPQRGSIRLNGADIGSVRREKGKVVRIGPAVPAASGQKLGKMAGADVASRAGLSGQLNAKVSELAPVQRVRLAIAQAVAARPALIILDAPASQLPLAAREDLAESLAQLVSGFGGVVVLLASSAGEALGLAGDIVVIDQGALVQRGAAADVSGHPVNLTAAIATSWPTLNTLVMTAREGGGTLPDGSRLQMPEGIVAPAEGKFTLAFHPEDATLERASPGCVRFVVRAGAEDVRGQHRFLNVTFAGATWLCPLATATPHPGALLNAFVDRSRLLVFDATGRATS